VHGLTFSAHLDLERPKSTATAILNWPEAQPTGHFLQRPHRPTTAPAFALSPLNRGRRAATYSDPVPTVSCRPTCAPSLSLRGFSTEAKTHFSSLHLSSASLYFLCTEFSPSRAAPPCASPWCRAFLCCSAVLSRADHRWLSYARTRPSSLPPSLHRVESIPEHSCRPPSSAAGGSSSTMRH
jgi:hypothetical protein